FLIQLEIFRSCFSIANQKGLPRLGISSLYFTSGRHDPAEFRRLTDRIQIGVTVHDIEVEASLEAIGKELESAQPVLRILPRSQSVDASHLVEVGGSGVDQQSDFGVGQGI